MCVQTVDSGRGRGDDGVEVGWQRINSEIDSFLILRCFMSLTQFDIDVDVMY